MIADDAVGADQLTSAVVIGSLSAGMLVTESEGIGSNDNDTTIATSKVTQVVQLKTMSIHKSLLRTWISKLIQVVHCQSILIVKPFQSLVHNEITTQVQETKSKSDFLIMLLLLET